MDVESTTCNTQVYNSTYEEAKLISMNCRSLAKEQTGKEIPLRASSALSAPVNPWPKKNESHTRENALIMTKRKMYWKRPGQSNSWDQYGDSSSATSASASAEEGGKGVHSMPAAYPVSMVR